jgi:hypothetical protein
MLMSQRHDQPKDRSQRMAPCDDQETFEAGPWMSREGARAEKTAKL